MYFRLVSAHVYIAVLGQYHTLTRSTLAYVAYQRKACSCAQKDTSKCQSLEYQFPAFVLLALYNNKDVSGGNSDPSYSRLVGCVAAQTMNLKEVKRGEVMEEKCESVR